MAFKLSDSNEFEAKVDVVTPVGREQEAKWSFYAKFRILTDADVNEGRGNILEHSLVGVSDFKGCETPADAEPEELLRMVRARPDSQAAIIRVYRDQVSKKNRGSSF